MRHSILCLTGVLFALSCGKRDAAAPSAARAPSEERERAATAADKNGKQQAPAAELFRKVIRNGELHIVVKAYAPARRAIEDALRQAGGYVSSSRVDHSLGQISSATLVLRIPAGRFGDFTAFVSRLGVVAREATSSQDVTEAYFDVKARLQNAKRLETRLAELLAKQTTRIGDVLEVERELARVRGEIERYEGKLRLWDNLVDLSTLTITLQVQERYVPPAPPSFLDDVRAALQGSFDSLRAFARGVVLFLVALGPWIVPLGGLTWGAWALWRRFRRRRAAAKATDAKP